MIVFGKILKKVLGLYGTEILLMVAYCVCAKVLVFFHFSSLLLQRVHLLVSCVAVGRQHSQAKQPSSLGGGGIASNVSGNGNHWITNLMEPGSQYRDILGTQRLIQKT